MHTIRVLFKDGTFIDVENVTDCKVDNEYNMFFLFKKDHKVMIPRDTVKALGYVEDLPGF